MRIGIGIDPSLTNCAVAARWKWPVRGDDSTIRTTAERVFHTKASQFDDDLRGRMARYERLIGDVMTWIGQQTTGEGRPYFYSGVVVIEHYSFNLGAAGKDSDGKPRSTNPRGILDRVEFGGLLRSRLLALEPIGWRIIELSPAELKMFATGKGNTKKPKLTSMLSKEFNRVFDGPDEADAFAAMLVALRLVDPREDFALATDLDRTRSELAFRLATKYRLA